MAISENSKKVISILQANADKDLVAADIADALGLTTKQVNGAFTSSLQNKKMGYREECEVELPDGTHKRVKFLRLNEAGMNYDVNSEG